jgi:hypothetical protein
MDLFFGDEAPPDAGLITDQDQEPSFGPGFPEGLPRSRQESHLLRVSQIGNIPDNRVIPVKK